jgi:hypothetical protein
MDRFLPVALALALAGCAGFPATQHAPDSLATGSGSGAGVRGDLTVHVESFKPPPSCDHACPTYSWPPPERRPGVAVAVWSGGETRAAVTDGSGDATFDGVLQGHVRVTALWNQGGDGPREQTLDQDLAGGGPWNVGMRFEMG